MSASLSIEDLTLIGTDEPFYLDEGETFVRATRMPGRAALVVIDTVDGSYVVLAGLSRPCEGRQ